MLGGIINPLYSLLIAHTNDYLSKEQMPAASAGLIFLNGFGAIFGPLVTGWLMGEVGARGYFLFIGALTNGLTKNEIKEIFMQTAIYCGVPAAVEAFRCAREVFEEDKLAARKAKKK